MKRAAPTREWALRMAAAAAVAVLILGCEGALENMKLQFTWGSFRYAFDSPQQREELLSRPDFAPENSTIFDVDVDVATNRVFLSLPALLPGYPATLATIKNVKVRDSPELKPYPDWSWHLGQRGCDGLTSVFRMYIDECRRLWIIDSGVVDITGSFTHKCPPQLVVFDLKTDQLILRHSLTVPSEYSDATLMLNVVAEQKGPFCNADAYAYIADPGSFAAYVFSLRSGRSWRVANDAFRPDANASEFEINGTRFTLEDGLLALAQDKKYLYFHSFSSFREGRVAKSVLRKESLFANGSSGPADKFEFIGSRASQSAGEALTDNVMVFGEMGTNSLYCWNSEAKYEKKNHHVVEQDDTLLLFLASVKVKPNCLHEEEVWVVDNNGQRLFAGEFQPNLPNTVNIMKGRASDVTRKCRPIWIFPWS